MRAGGVEPVEATLVCALAAQVSYGEVLPSLLLCPHMSDSQFCFRISPFGRVHLIAS
jgi:hypothetical protein